MSEGLVKALVDKLLEARTRALLTDKLLEIYWERWKQPTVRLYHGTNTVALAIANQRGEIRPLDPHAIASLVERHYNLPHDSVWNHTANEFSRGRANDPHVYLTGDPRVAASYANDGSEVLSDTLRAAYAILHPGDQYAGDRNTAWQRFRREYLSKMGYHPVVLNVDVPVEKIPIPQGSQIKDPYDWIGLAHQPDKDPINTISFPHPIPMSWVKT